jgi:hypothetical protein
MGLAPSIFEDEDDDEGRGREIAAEDAHNWQP